MAELSATERSSDRISDSLDSTEAGGRIIRGGVLRLGGYGAMLALSVISAALLTRYLGVTDFGHYTTVLSLVGVVAAITDAGMSAVGQREFAVREEAERDELMRDLLALRIVLTTIGVVLVTAFALAVGYGHALLEGTVLAALGTVALVIQHTHTIPITAELRLGTLSALDLARQALTVAAIVMLVLLEAGIMPLLAVTLAVNVLLIPPTAALAKHQISLRMALRPRRWAVLLRLTVSFSLATAVGTIYIYTAQILTSLVSSPHQSGLFAASFRVFIVIGAVPGVIVGGALPLLARAARDDRERLAYALQKIFEVSAILGVGAALGLLAGAHLIISVIADNEYAAAAGVLQIQGLALIASFMLAGWSFALLSLKRYTGVLLANLLAFAVSCSLTAVLASSDGARGAAIATVCGEGVLALGSLVALAYGHPELRPKLPIVVKLVLAGAPAALIALFLDVSSLIRVLLALLVYGVVIALTRAVPAEALELLPVRLRRVG